MRSDLSCSRKCGDSVARLNPDALRLYLVTDQSLTRGRSLIDLVDAAVQGGVSCVQLREKHLGTREFVEQALMLKKLLAPHRVPLVINDRIDVALACGAEGVHLGQRDLPVDQARRLLPPEVFIGWSVETMDDVAQSAGLPLDYLGVSPVFATPTKTDTKNFWGPSRADRGAGRHPFALGCHRRHSRGKRQ